MLERARRRYLTAKADTRDGGGAGGSGCDSAGVATDCSAGAAAGDVPRPAPPSDDTDAVEITDQTSLKSD